ncbi:hypothetical protein FOL47_008257 [Perkinsus chesapeaki]|uniref:Uncharacterized protein n=1 Tax=Perkinsus chesapeaki TaxID=330153 RepID=A0A7J6MU13_PERCH|nr:hypothetical protein FOL47_008257 [Perkinsus chesapeaki]
MSINQQSIAKPTNQQHQSGQSPEMQAASATTAAAGNSGVDSFFDDDTTFADMVNRPSTQSQGSGNTQQQQQQTTTANDVDSQADEDDDGPDLYTQLAEAIPMDKINNGLQQAGDFFYSAFNKAKEIGSENIQHVQESDTYNNLRTSATQNLESLQQSELGQQAAHAADAAKAKATEMKEDWSPTIAQAKESAYSWMSSAAKSASSAAIWFQSMGTSGEDADDSDEDGQQPSKAQHGSASGEADKKD